MNTFILPLPETTNHGYATAGGRWYKTAKQKAWEEEAGMMVRVYWGRKKPLEGELEVSIMLWVKRDRDIDGSIKPILDLFQRMRVYENDRQIRTLTVYKFRTKTDPKVEVKIS